MMDRQRIAIVGGGASGALVLLHLLRHAGPRRLEVYLIERSGVFGRGVAYAEQPLCCLLNVPAMGMGLFDGEPMGFVDWLSARGRPVSPTEFVPRAWFGDFLEEALLGAACAAPVHHRVRLLTTAAVRINPLPAPGQTLRIALADGHALDVDALVLATGNELSSEPAAWPQGLSDSPRYIADPWRSGALSGVPTDARVLILGTGLTAVDVILTLQAQGFRGRIVSASRRGLLPLVHPSPAPAGSFPLGEVLDQARRGGLAALVHAVRGEVRRAQASGLGWHSVMAGLRPQTAALWAALPLRDRGRFLRHLRPYWEVHRHRMAPAVARRLEALRAAGLLEVRAARLAGWRAGADGVGVRLQQRAAGGPQREEVFDRVINCTTPNRVSAHTENPILRAAVRRGVLQADPLGLGFRRGDARLSIHTMGALRIGELWECTAVPELRAQARAVTLSILSQSQRTAAALGEASI